MSGDDFDDDPIDDDDDTSEVVSCPACGAEIYEDAVRCPSCGEYVTHGTSAISGRPMWFALLGLAGIVATIVALSLAW